MTQFEPEIGQMIFGQPYKEFSCGPYIEAALAMLREELDRVMHNIHQKDYDSPFNNSGNQFECSAFKCHAYDWNDDAEQPFNFKWKDVEISWYKYLGRGMSVNREFKPDECAVMLRECLDALRAYEKEHNPHEF